MLKSTHPYLPYKRGIIMKKLLFTLSTLLFLQGCIAGALVGSGAAAGSTLANDKRTFSTITEDEKITYDANQHLLADNAIADKAHIVVATYNHRVLLTGQAPTEELRNKAVQIVSGLPRVQKVYNQIQIDEPIPAIRRSQDALITANVKSRLIATTNVKASQFKIVTENATVYIMGISTREQTNLVVDVVRNSTGVKRIIKVVEYI